MTPYVIAEVEHLSTPEVVKYWELSQAAGLQYGGRHLARGAFPDVLEGDWPDVNRMVVIEFPGVERARSWYGSPECAAARATRRDLGGRRILLVPGAGEPTGLITAVGGPGAGQRCFL